MKKNTEIIIVIMFLIGFATLSKAQRLEEISSTALKGHISYDNAPEVFVAIISEESPDSWSSLFVWGDGYYFDDIKHNNGYDHKDGYSLRIDNYEQSVYYYGTDQIYNDINGQNEVCRMNPIPWGDSYIVGLMPKDWFEKNNNHWYSIPEKIAAYTVVFHDGSAHGDTLLKTSHFLNRKIYLNMLPGNDKIWKIAAGL